MLKFNSVFVRFACAVFLLFFYETAKAVDRSKFRTCASTGFCRRFRDTTVSSSTAGGRGPWKVVPGSLQVTNDLFRARLLSEGSVAHPGLNLIVQLYKNNAIRVQFSEDKPRWQPLDLLMPLPLDSHRVLSAGDVHLPEAILFIYSLLHMYRFLNSIHSPFN
jgi:hypothetical protein